MPFYSFFSWDPSHFQVRFQMVCLDLNCCSPDFGTCLFYAPYFTRTGDIPVRKCFYVSLSTAPWLAGLACRLSMSVLCLLAKFTQGDYLFSPGVEFQGQSTQLVVKLRTPGRECFTCRALGVFPQRSGFFTYESSSKAAWLQAPSPSRFNTRGFR